MDQNVDHEPELPLECEEPPLTPVPGASLNRQVSAVPVSRDLESTASLRVFPEQEFYLPVHGFVRLTKEEVRITDHPAFQRLGWIYQLGLAHLVFRGATHRRIEHVLGSLHIAEQICSAVNANYLRAAGQTVTPPWSTPLTERERAFIRLGALLHDIGHLPAGHTLEDELGLLDKHDEVTRLNLILDRISWPGGEAPTLRSVINLNYASWIPNATVEPVEVVLHVIAKDPPRNTKQSVDNIIRTDVCRDIVGNTICADLIDYLHRDWYHIGKPKHLETRLFQYMEIREDDGKHKFVISLGEGARPRTDAISNILNLLESRYELSEAVLFHRTKCSAAAMLERGVKEIELSVAAKERSKWLAMLKETLLDHSDESAIQFLSDEARGQQADAAVRVLASLRQRRLYKEIVTVGENLLPAEERAIERTFLSESKTASTNRVNALRIFEDEFGLPSGSLAMYCPDRKMNQKIAQVKIQVHGCVDPFDQREEEHGDELSGGHLTAQLRRFRRLWRIHVFVDEVVWEHFSPKLRHTLRDAIRLLVLGKNTDPYLSVHEQIGRMARDFAELPGTPFTNRQLVEASFTRSRDTGYPLGAPRLSSFFAG